MNKLQQMLGLVTELPKVTEETKIRLLTEVFDGENYFTTVLERLQVENPLVVEWLEYFLKGVADPAAVRSAGTFVYRLLESAGPVPQLLEETALDVQREFLEKDSYLVNLIQRVQKENPTIANFVIHYSDCLAAKNRLNDLTPLKTAYAGMLLYRVLERQAELNKEMLSWL